MSHENYLHRRNQFIRSFDRLLARVKPSVISWLGKEQAERFMRELRQEYEALIPRIPFIGNNLAILTFYMPVTRYLAVYRALQNQKDGPLRKGWAPDLSHGYRRSAGDLTSGCRTDGSSLVFLVAQEADQKKGNQVATTHIPCRLCYELRGR